MIIKNELKRLSGSWYFMISVFLIYVFLFILRPETFFSSINYFFDIIIKIIPIFIFVFVLMVITNYFINPKLIAKHLIGKGLKKWLLVIVGGILSTGPIYLWYPLLADLKKKGLDDGLIACFLYNRAIKIPLLPIAVLYFGWCYIIVLSIVMVFASISQALLLNYLMNKIYENSRSV